MKRHIYMGKDRDWEKGNLNESELLWKKNSMKNI